MTPARKILMGVVLLFIVSYGLVSFLSPTSGKPNILVIMVDDLGYNDLAINNDNADMQTPNMDQLARDGVRYTRHYAAAVCSPARAAFLAGMYPERLGYLPNGPGLSPGLVTLPDRLKEEGYTTWHIGKWHIGDLERKAWPDYQGFDHWFGFLNQWRLAGKHVDDELVMSMPRYHNPWLQGDTESGRFFAGHLENILRDKAIEVITGLHNGRAPWFVNLWFYAPHGPVQPAAEFAKNYPDTPEGRYRALVNQLDTNIGRVLSHMESIGALENTIVVVVSDNGGRNLESNVPYIGKKTQLLEGGLRTPLIIRWPDESLNGEVYSDTVSIEDIYPTLMAAIGVEAPENLDGQSFYPGSSGPEAKQQRAHFRQAGRGTHGVLSADGDWRLYQPPDFWGQSPALMLFDLAQDPYGTNAMQAPPKQILASMTDSYKTWYRDVHTVNTHFVPDGSGGGVLSGMDFLRTPGFGGYTLGIGLPHTFEGRIAAQGDIWKLHREGNKVVAKFGSLILSGEVKANDRTCHSIVVSGESWRQIASNSGPDHIILALYIDGMKVDSMSADATLEVADPTVDTLVGNQEKSDQSSVLLPPVILNTRLTASTPWTLDSFSRELCQGAE
jgi:arylsulfatase A-like enzyme